jgi:fumarylpyruvate hydrolase
VDGQVEQDSDVAKLIWPVPDIIAIISRSMELRPGDLSTTGAPEGVAPVERGETMTGGIGPDAKDAARY